MITEIWKALNKQLSIASIEAAINFVEVCNEHTAIIGGRNNTSDPIVSTCKLFSYNIISVTLKAELLPSAPLAQGGKSDEELAGHCLKIPGSHLNLSVLLDKKKFRTYGHKPGALRGFNVLKEDELGTLEHCGGRGANKVNSYICAIMNLIELTIKTNATYIVV